MYRFWNEACPYVPIEGGDINIAEELTGSPAI